MPSERVQHAYGLIQKTLQQSGIIHGTSKQHQGSDPNPYGYSNVSQQTSWQQAGPPPPPPTSGYGQNAYGSMPGGSLAAPGPPAPPLVTPTQVTYNSPPIPPPYGPLNSQSWTTAPQSHAGTATINSSYASAHAPTPQQTQGFQSMFPPPPPLPPKPQDYSVHPPPLPPRPGTQGPPTDQSSAWSRPQVQTVQSTPSFQSPPPTAHHIYRKYGHVLQDVSGTPTNAFQPPSALQNQTPTAPLPPPPPQQAWQQHNQGNYQNIYTTTPQQQTWQAPAAHQQTPVSPVQHDQQLYATTHTPVNQSYPPPPQVFQSPAQQTPLKVPSVSPPPYNWAQPPPMQPGPAPSDYFQHSTTPQPYFQRPPSLGNNPYQRPDSLGNNPYNPPVSPPIPTVSPLVSRQGSVNSQQGARDRHDTVSSISTTAAHERHDTFSTVSTLGERPTTPKAEPQSETVGGVSGQRIQSTGAGATTAAGTSASALGFGGPGGWEYYDALGEEDEEEEEVAVGKSEAKDQFKAAEHDPVSPVELPSDPAPFAMKPPAAAETKNDDAGENAIFELPADFVMEPSVKPEVSADQSKEGQDATIVLPKPSTRYNRIPRPQDLIPDLGPWYASSLERFISMLKTEAHAASDEQRAAAFMEFVATESKLRGIPYYTQPPGDDVQRSVNNGEKRPKLPLEIPPSDAATEMEIQYSPGGRPVWRPKPKDRQNSDEAKTTVPGGNQHQAYKPFRQGQSTTDGEGSNQPAVPTPTGLPSEQTGPATAIQQAQYKPYTPSTPAVEAIRRDSLPRRDSFPRSDSFPHRSSVSSPIRQEHTETFFPAPLALHSKKDQTTSSSSSSSNSTPKPVPSITAPPPDEVSTPETSLPYPTTPSHTPPPPQPPALGTKPTLSSLTPAPLAPSTVAPPPPPPQTGAARLRALLANFKPSSSSAETTTQIVTTLSALPPLDATQAHIAALNASFDGSSPPAAPAARQARALYDELAADRGEQQVLNDMAFEANEITYPQLLGRDEALKKEDAEKVAARAAGLMDAAGKRYRAWEEAVFAGVYGRVREEVGAGVEGLAVVEDVGAEAVKALEGEEEQQQAPDAAAAAPGSGLVKINARTGEVITVDGLASATAAAKPSHPGPAAPTSSAAANVAQTLSALTTLTTSARALLTLHAHISARHALLAATVADRDARYAAAETAPLEFLVAFDECENPHSTTASSGKKAAAADKEEGKEGDADADADARKKLLDLRKHFTAARLGASARAAADEEVRARQTWQRVEGWMAAGLAAVAKAVEGVSAAARQVEANDDDGSGVSGLLDRAEAVVGELARRAQELVRCFHEAEVLLNEAEFAVSVEEARAAVFEKAVARGDGPGGWGGWEEEARVVVGKLEEERRNEDGVLKDELESRLRVIDTEQKAKAMEVVRRVRKRVVGREEFGDEDRIVGWVS